MASIALDHVLGDAKEVNTIKQQVFMGRCDSCDQRATHEATKDKLRLNFCGHHTRQNAKDILGKGFKILPEDYLFNLND